jgi:hypothetical protein
MGLHISSPPSNFLQQLLFEDVPVDDLPVELEHVKVQEYVRRKLRDRVIADLKTDGKISQDYQLTKLISNAEEQEI